MIRATVEWESALVHPPKEEKFYLCGGARGGVFVGKIYTRPHIWVMQGTSRPRKAEYYSELPEVPR